MQTLFPLISFFLVLSGLISGWGFAHAEGDFCKWIDEQGVTHYAKECPEDEETKLIETEAPLTEAQQEAARQRSEELLQSSRTFSLSKSSSLHRFRSLPAGRLGPLPENTVSKYVQTIGTGILFSKDDQGRFSLFVQTRNSLPRGSYLEVHFPDPGNPAKKNIVGKEVQAVGSKLLFESPRSDQFRCWNYEVLVNVYSDRTKSEMLDRHFQFIQSSYDVRFFDDDRPYVSQVLEGAKCPSGREEEMSRMSVEQLDLLCEEEREKRLKPERERLIRKCIENMGKNEEYCTNFYADHGDAVRIDPVHARPALYYDLPACVAARKAREQEK